MKQQLEKMVLEAEENLKSEFAKVDLRCMRNSQKVLAAFQKNRISEVHFGSTTGYGYDDLGRDTIEKVFADILGAEDALVRTQFISGTHAITVLLFAMLRPGDTMLSICGKPYDTLDSIIGFDDNPSSLKSYQIHYEQIDLVNNDFDIPKIVERVAQKNVKLVEIQRSRGYALRESLTIEKIEKVIKAIRQVNQDVIIMVDNCYGEFVDEKEPLAVGADIMVGSLIKNLGGGLAPNGAYIAGKKDLVNLAAERLTSPGQRKRSRTNIGH